MGDLKSVDIAQALHEGILGAHGAFGRDHLLRYGTPVPRSSLWFGIYIDDVFMVHVLRREAVKQIPGPRADVRLMKNIGTVYQNNPGVTETNEKRWTLRGDASKFTLRAGGGEARCLQRYRWISSCKA